MVAAGAIWNSNLKAERDEHVSPRRDGERSQSPPVFYAFEARQLPRLHRLQDTWRSRLRTADCRSHGAYTIGYFADTGAKVLVFMPETVGLPWALDSTEAVS